MKDKHSQAAEVNCQLRMEIYLSSFVSLWIRKGLKQDCDMIFFVHTSNLP